MTPPAKNVVTIPAGQPFVDRLADGILADLGGVDPGVADLADATVLLPTRRAGLALRDAFLRRSDGRPLILPRIRPLGEVAPDETILAAELAPGADLPPPVGDLRRRLLLARMIWSLPDRDVAPGQAVGLAAALARLLDEIETERLGFEGLEALVPEELAKHWTEILKFLTIATLHWPRMLTEEGAIDPAEHRNRMLAAQAELWRTRPPKGRIYAAGSTGSVPATADLLAVVAGLPAGLVVLPGLDREMDEGDWALLDDSHPQAGMRRLLTRLGVAREEVADWPAAEPEASGPDRRALIREVMRPAETSSAWGRGLTLAPSTLRDLSRIDCESQEEEAGVVALAMRETLETPGRTAALVTPDRALARRVAAALGRWGITVDDSAGLPLAETAAGAFLRLALEAAVHRWAPVPLLALAKHPLFAAGAPVSTARAATRALELTLLRGPRPAPGPDGLRGALADTKLGEHERRLIAGLIDRLEAALAPLEPLAETVQLPLAGWFEAHALAAEALAATSSEAGPLRLWSGDDGEAAARFFAEAIEAARDVPAVEARDYPAIFEALAAGPVVRPRYGDHPRLYIWGPLEARLQHADLVILGGLNEGAWPRDPGVDPWMSRPMRARFGLPSLERRIGLSAHDVAQLMAAPRVLLTRSERVEGTPQVASRWLLRLETVLAGAGLTLPAAPPYRRWAALVDAPDAPPEPARDPRPTPPVGARPHDLSVTDVEQWLRNPYGFYAKRILGLRRLEPIDADPGAADRGLIIHDVLADFLEAYPAALPPDARTALLALGRRAFARLAERPGLHAFWWPRFERVADFVLAEQAGRVARGTDVAGLEIDASADLRMGEVPIRLRARADRIDRGADGYRIIDYKTGGVPSPKEMKAGVAPQLPLEGLLLRRGAFAAREGEALPAGTVAGLEYWRLTGNAVPGEVKPFQTEAAKAETADGVAAAIDEAEDRLRRLVLAFEQPGRAYLCRPQPDFAPRHDDYHHLARVDEWMGSDEEEL